MTNYTDKLKKLEIIANKILAIDSTPMVKLTHTYWNTKQTETGIVEIPLTHSFKIVIMGDEVAHANSIEELQEKLINILAQ